jgi:hypothetical protein
MLKTRAAATAWPPRHCPSMRSPPRPPRRPSPTSSTPTAGSFDWKTNGARSIDAYLFTA